MHIIQLITDAKSASINPIAYAVMLSEYSDSKIGFKNELIFKSHKNSTPSRHKNLTYGID